MSTVQRALQDSVQLTVRALSGTLAFGPVAVPRTFTVQDLKVMLRKDHPHQQCPFDVIRGHEVAKLVGRDLLQYDNIEHQVEVQIVYRQWTKGACTWKDSHSESWEEGYFWVVEVFDGNAEDLMSCFISQRTRLSERERNDYVEVHGDDSGFKPEIREICADAGSFIREEQFGTSRITEIREDDGSFIRQQFGCIEVQYAFDKDLESLQELRDYTMEETCSYFTYYDEENWAYKWQYDVAEMFVGRLRIRFTHHGRPGSN